MKRLLDLLASAVSLILLSPLLAAIAIAIRLDTPGPALYVSWRVGKGGKPFRFYKFRTMVTGADRLGAGLEVEAKDPRVTRTGRWLRRASLDELPQLLNVLLGEMSLVGPRPTVASQVERYTGQQRRRLEMPPGMTGWAQVNGRNLLTWPQRIELDIWYIDHWSLALDLRILFRTLPAMVSSRGLYDADGATRDL